MSNRAAPSISTARTLSRSLAAIPAWLLLPILFAAVLLSHATLLRLPYFWDEAGYYIPAAWDLFRTGTLIPVTTTTNAHPPLPSLLLAGWWHVLGFSPLATRTLVALVASVALTAVFRLARDLTTPAVALATTLLTALYPIWFAQSTLAHADMFAAAFTLLALSFYLPRTHPAWVALLFAAAALSKETAIVTPIALAALELTRRNRKGAAALAAPILPLIAWYAYHRARTGFTFGNPEYLRYNATANLAPIRIGLSLYHRLLHLTVHMNLFVATGCTLAALLMPKLAARTRIPRQALIAIATILAANLLAFSILGGALLTRYLLPLYPLILLLCVAEWRLHLRRWPALAALTAAAFLAALWIAPPYAFAPEDNLTYRDFVLLHQQAASFLATHYPAATVLTAWPATQELARPELGYTQTLIQTVQIQNFSAEEIQKAAADPGAYDTALLFSTKWEPRPGTLNLARRNDPNDTRYFDFHHDLRPAQAARLLHGEVVWQQARGSEWAAILHFPRAVNAAAQPSNPIMALAPLSPHKDSRP